MDLRSLRLLEFDRVAAAVAAHAASAPARTRLEHWAPIADPAERARETARLAEAIARVGEPGEWCFVADGSLDEALAQGDHAVLDGVTLLAVAAWLEAAEATLAAWEADDVRERHAGLAAVVDQLAPPPGLRQRIADTLDADGRVKDSASPELKRLRHEQLVAERRLEQQLERWARSFGSDSYVTRHGGRFVAMVPAAGFPRRRAIVHDVSGSGQSLFVEPLEMCEENNRILELGAAASEEERRILHALRAVVLDARDALLALGDVLTRLDALRARARWGRSLGGRAIAAAGQLLVLRRARHPLLAETALADPSQPVVPLELALGRPHDGVPERLLLVSGPNMGGKTVLLKTVGLAVLCAHAAFPVVADEGSEVPAIERVHVDLGDEQSLAQGLSTFAAHLEVLKRIAEDAGPGTLVLCDELGAGTDPDEGGSLARALLEHLARRSAWGVITTHLGSLKRVAGEVPGVVNGSLEFDLDTLRSRYRFIAGVPGASHALAVAERLGFPPALLSRARALTPESARALERLTGELTAATVAARANAEALDRSRAEADSAAAALREATEMARRELAERRHALTRESEALLARVRELWQTVQREAKRADKSKLEAGRMREELKTLEQAAAALAGSLENGHGDGGRGLSADRVTPGQRVRIADLGVDADVVTAPDPEGRVELRRGSWTIHSHVSRLSPAADVVALPRASGTWSIPDDAPALEVDLRGMEVSDALAELDAGLDRAVLSGLGELRVIHGIGRGVLRAAVERHLKGHPQVADGRMGQTHEGGRGVTVARLR